MQDVSNADYFSAHVDVLETIALLPRSQTKWSTWLWPHQHVALSDKTKTQRNLSMPTILQYITEIYFRIEKYELVSSASRFNVKKDDNIFLRINEVFEAINDSERWPLLELSVELCLASHFIPKNIHEFSVVSG